MTKSQRRTPKTHFKMSRNYEGPIVFFAFVIDRTKRFPGALLFAVNGFGFSRLSQLSNK